MGQREGAHRHPGDLRLAVRCERPSGQLGFAGPGGRGRPVEDVAEAARQLGERARRAVHLETGGVPHRDGPEVVDPVDVVRVGVSEEHRVHRGHARGHELETQLGRRVDQQAASPRLEQRGRATAFVTRIGRGTGDAAAAGPHP